MWSFMLSFLLLVRLHLFIYVSQLFLACQNPGCQRLAARVAVCCPSNALLCLIFLAASKLATRKGWSYMLSRFVQLLRFPSCYKLFLLRSVSLAARKLAARKRLFKITQFGPSCCCHKK